MGRDTDRLISTLSAFMRRKFEINVDKPHWDDEEYGQLIVGMYAEVQEFLVELGSPDATPESIWNEAADIANYCSMIADVAGKRKRKEELCQIQVEQRS